MQKEQLQDLFTNMLNRKLDEPWEKPWFTPINNNSYLTNYKTGRQYKNGNFFLLLFASVFSGFNTLQFMTYKQGISLGYMVNKGSEGLPVFYYNFKYYKREGEKRIPLPESPYNTWSNTQLIASGIFKIPFIKIHHVFNVSQFTNLQTGLSLESEINSKLIDKEEANINTNPEKLLEGCEEILKSWECEIKLVKGSGICFYVPSLDFIQLAEREQFKNNEFFYATMMHEVTHSTGHDKRTGRINKFKDSYETEKESYAIEELVAEIASAFIMASNNFATEHQRVNSAVYLQGWKKSLKDDENLALKVCNEAYKAVSYIAERFPRSVPFFNVCTESHMGEAVEDLEILND